jgi:large subunit ribosomal protein L10
VIENKAVRTEKKEIVKELKDKLLATKGAVLTNYRGLTVAMDTKMRRKLREAGVEYRVVKNTMTRIAAHDAGIDGLDKYLEGPTAIALSVTDPVAPAKVLADFIRENKLQVLEIKAGLVEGKVVDVDGVKALASLPPREVLIAQLLGTMQAPIAGFVRVLGGVPSNLVYALEAIRKQKEWLLHKKIVSFRKRIYVEVFCNEQRANH